MNTKEFTVMNVVRRLLFTILAAVGSVFLISCPGPNPAGPVSGGGPDAFILNAKVNGVYTNDGSGNFTKQKPPPIRTRALMRYSTILIPTET